MTRSLQQLDPAADFILDFIAGGVPDNPSGESAGNYDAVFGDIDGSEYGVLAEKNFGEIYEMQSEMLADNGISTATGRYQALKSTLQEYQKRAGVTNEVMFTEIIQDDFGLKKMEDRGYDSWMASGISDDEFMHRLSCEWASLPDPYNGGKSHYDGDSAGNHASTSLSCFRNCLTQARELLASRPQLVKRMDERQALSEIQRVLVRSGDLPLAGVDGVWGPQSESAINTLIARSTSAT